MTNLKITSDAGDAGSTAKPQADQSTFAGANHPLSKESAQQTAKSSPKAVATDVAPSSEPSTKVNPDDFTGAVEVVTDSSGKTKEVPLTKDKLSAGDHTIEFENGRQFVVHVPQDAGKAELPVMFVISPSVNPTGSSHPNASQFETQTGMNQYADQDKFVAVYAVPQEHLLGQNSKTPAFAWNAPGSGINNSDQKLAGYNDENYINAIVGLVPQLTNADSTHKDWGAIGFSQGGMFLNQLVHDEPNLFPTVGLVGSSMETNHDYSTAQGNAKNVMIENLHGDGITLPYPEDETFKFKAEKAFADGLNLSTPTPPGDLPEGDGIKFAEQESPLGAIDNRDQNPHIMENLYEQNLKSLGSYSEQAQTLKSLPGGKKDQLESYTSNASPNSLNIVDLGTAPHAYPGPDHGVDVSAATPYPDFDTSAFFANLFDKYNQSEKQLKQ